ncbi:polysaccharide pyruvyl transferase family protein [Pararhizobium sp.]|uniref:polysaccharide pyruvyl transferase family protein n=1 Tax=Pararhizobium sp. TaxID=1977563 RepID=UPI003D115E3E
MYTMLEIYDAVSRFPALRDIRSQHVPQDAVLEMMTRKGTAQKTVETGFSPLSIMLFGLDVPHVCLAPSEDAAGEIRMLIASLFPKARQPDIRVGHVFDVAAGLEAEGFDLAIVSAEPNFPDYFTATHLAMRCLKTGGKLVLCGASAWPSEQLRNFLRIDHGWSSYDRIGENAVTVQKSFSGPTPSWKQQPYVALNTTHLATGQAAKMRKSSALSGIKSFSSALDALRAQKGRLTAASPKLGLVGYYGFGNYGDELFRVAFETEFAEYDVRMLHDFPRRPYFLGPKADKVAQIDGIIIGGGDIVIPGYWTDLYFEEDYLEKPVFIHGVGIPRWTGGEAKVIARLRNFFQHDNVKHIHVRDIESKIWVEKHLRPHIEVMLSSDIVFGMTEKPAEPTAVNGAPVFGLITRRQPAHENDYRRLKNLLARVRQRGYFIRHIIAGSGIIGEQDLDDAQLQAFDVDETIAVETVEEINGAIRDCKLVASMKFHGCVVGLMSAIPTIGLLTTDKFTNLYRLIGRDDLLCHYQDARMETLLDGSLTALAPAEIQRLRDGATHAMSLLRQAVKASL